MSIYHTHLLFRLLLLMLLLHHSRLLHSHLRLLHTHLWLLLLLLLNHLRWWLNHLRLLLFRRWHHCHSSSSSPILLLLHSHLTCSTLLLHMTIHSRWHLLWGGDTSTYSFTTTTLLVLHSGHSTNYRSSSTHVSLCRRSRNPLLLLLSLPLLLHPTLPPNPHQTSRQNRRQPQPLLRHTNNQMHRNRKFHHIQFIIHRIIIAHGPNDLELITIQTRF
mmetsp:Transcript_1361/g.2191  ORF Transcript_1361/g.2191 Transcript_1361/m.2191 type:complete len:217 (-) Transcript_1361:827-1477(-)